MSNGADDSLLKLLYLGQVLVCVNVACFAAAVYDNLHTLPLEIRYIWLSRVTIATILYYISRYGLYIDFILLTYSNFTPSITLKGCTYTVWVVGYAYDICMWTGEALLGLRVWALCGRDRRLTFTLPVIFAALFTTSLVTLGTFFNSLKYGPSPAPMIISCFIVQANEDIIKTIICPVVWICLEVMVILLMRSAYYEYKSGGNSRLIRMVYNEGLIYYFYTLVLHVGNLIAFYMGPPEVFAILTRQVIVFDLDSVDYMKMLAPLVSFTSHLLAGFSFTLDSIYDKLLLSSTPWERHLIEKRGQVHETPIRSLDR